MRINSKNERKISIESCINLVNALKYSEITNVNKNNTLWFN